MQEFALRPVAVGPCWSTGEVRRLATSLWVVEAPWLTGRQGFNGSRVARVLASAGVVGGLVGFGLGEIQTNDEEANRFFPDDLNASSAVYFALVMLGIGTALAASQGLSERNFSKAGDTVLRALPAIVIGGFISGFIAQSVFSNMLEDGGSVRVARAIGWMLAGGLGGVALGIGFRSKKRIQNGLIGGAVGGLVGGLIFDSITTETSAQPSRFVALLVIGGLMGLLIGLVDTLRTEIWLTVTSGEMTGRQFIIYDETTIVGCARNIPVTLLADRDVAEHHIQIERISGATKFTCMHNAAPVLVNGAQQTSGSLGGGDLIRIGNTELKVGERNVDSPAPTTVQGEDTAGSAEQSRPVLYSDKDDSGPPPSRTAQDRPPSTTKRPTQERRRPTIQMKPKDDD